MKKFRFKNLIPVIVLFIGISSCDKDDDKTPGILEYIESFGNEVLKDIPIDVMEISPEGELFLIVNNALANGADIHFFNSDYSYGGLFKDTAENQIKAKLMIFDKENKLHLADFSLAYGTKHMVYETDGTPVSEEIVGHYSLFNLAIASNESEEDIYVIPTLNSQNEDIFILKYDVVQDDTSIYLTNSDINAMIPNFEDGHNYMFADIFAKDNKVYITVDKQNGDGSGDGILILDNNLKFIRYIGSNWLFNGPRGVEVDAEGNIYATSIYNDNLKVFNNQYQLVAQTSLNDLGGSADGKMKRPSEVEIYNNKVFVLDGGNDRICVFETFTD